MLTEKYKDEIFKCYQCGLCKAICPTFELSKNESLSSRGRMTLCYLLLTGNLHYSQRLVERFFECTTCGGCSASCSMGLNIPNIIESIRADLVSAGIAPLTNQKLWKDHAKIEHNPYMEKHIDRTKWLPQEIRDKLPRKAGSVYFIGCTSSYRQKNIARATVEFLRHIGFDFTILEDEWCCGSPLLRTGQWEFIEDLAQHNVNAIDKVEAENVITSCAGCYKTLKIDSKEAYKDLIGVDFDFKILHISEVIANLIKGGEINFERALNAKVTYHDPCHLGRHSGIYNPPREVLKAIPELDLVEMPKNKETALCCGAGGGFKSGFREEAIAIASMRIQEALNTGAEILTTSCPFCYQNFYDAILAHGLKIKLLDMVEIVNHAIGIGR